jgi:mannose-1-phosphate guanylyltransferase / mannose-6-phosphate isomerase
MKKHIVPVILCGGSGTRLWPLSRAGFPKQFLILSGNSSLFQLTAERSRQLACEDIHVGETLVVTNEEQRYLALEQLREIGVMSARLLLEPVGRNTAPALTLAALQVVSTGDDPIMVVTPADHIVKNAEVFTNQMRAAVSAAADGDIIMLGVTPDRPETGFGYLRRSPEVQRNGICTVTQFAEKPDLATAQAYLDSGEYSWNSGIFVLKASTWLKAVKFFCPDIANGVAAAWANKKDDGLFVRPEVQSFTALAGESIDYAVIEKCPGSGFSVRMLPLDAGWNDLGAWDSVWMTGAQDSNGNVVQGDVLLSATSDSLVFAENRLICTHGVNNLVIVETADAVLVVEKNQSQHVKKIVGALEQRKRKELVQHRKVHRPWGWYDSIDEEARFKVKRILVNPGASLSLQKHHHRAEHWIVVKGTAEVTCGNKTLLLTENQSTYIPLGEIHRLANPGTIPLEIIEVQSGSYLGEDDIVRIEDTYGRN